MKHNYHLLLTSFSVLLVLSAPVAWFSYHLLPGTKVQGHDLGNQTRAQAERSLSAITLPPTINMHAGNVTVPVPVGSLGLSVNATNTYATIRAAQLSSVLHNNNKRVLLLPQYSIDETVARKELIAVLKPLQSEPVNAELQFNASAVTVKDSQLGQDFSVDEAVQKLHQAVTLSSPSIILTAQPLAPNVTTTQLQGSKKQLEGILSTNVSLVSGADTYSVSSSRISQMLSYNSSTNSVTLDPTAVSVFIKKIAGYVDVASQDETHVSLDGRELSVVAGTAGKHLDQQSASTTLTNRTINILEPSYAA